MKTKDLIKQLQNMVDAHETSGALEVMGEHEIVIDVWVGGTAFNSKTWQYAGFSGNIEITYSADGVYPILAAKESWLEDIVHS